MDRPQQLMAICLWLSLFSSLALVSMTTYSFYSDNGNYIDVVNDPGWMSTLPEDLSREVSLEIADILSLDEEATERVYEAILSSTDENWANSEGIEVINDIVDYITSKDMVIDSSISISEYKTPVIQAIITFIPNFLAETISELLPDSIPLKALIRMKDLDNTQDIFDFMEQFRIVILVILTLSIPATVLFKLTKHEYVNLFFKTSLFSLLIGILAIILMTLRIKVSFDKIGLSFVQSFGSNLNIGYLKYSLPFLIMPLILLVVSYYLKMGIFREID